MEVDTPTKIDNVKNLYSKVNKKTQFIIECAVLVGLKPRSLRAHWFGGFWSIPDAHIDTVIDFLQKTIKKQNEDAKA